MKIRTPLVFYNEGDSVDALEDVATIGVSTRTQDEGKEMGEIKIKTGREFEGKWGLLIYTY